MSKKEFEFNKFKNKGGSFLPFLIASAIILLSVLLLRNCNSPNKFYSGSDPGNNPSNPNMNSPISSNPNRNNPYNPSFPSNPNRLLPIDTAKIIIPNDPLQRPRLSNLLNVYVEESTDLESFSNHVISSYKSDSLKVTYYADAYKRIQFQVPPTRQEELKTLLKEDFEQVKFVCYESVLQTFQTKKDPGFSNPSFSWFYEQIGLFDAWNKTKGNSDLRIAVLDDSFDPNHIEIKNQIVSPWNVFEYSDEIKTYNRLFHGTHVAGTVVGEYGNGEGISGIAPNCKLIPVQIADRNGRMTTSSILDGIFYAIHNGATVINMSLGIDLSHAFGNIGEEEQKNVSKSLYLDEAAMWNEVYELADKEGITIIQAAGNSNVITGLDPMKRSKNTIVVGATDKNGRKANFSNYGEEVDIYAPGVKIYSSYPGQEFKLLDGTSMASPMVAGCVALMKSIDRNLSTEDIKKLMQETSRVFDGKHQVIQINQILDKIQ